ncbi:helical backbone metal receptor [Immundisolibacter sp.]|uniref:helical backbone metal receptor n=1 Tax=Immundisolibacter sp. TaxID=1934948 RepID=UPI000EDAD7C6|nr:cobalamin-binding protein [Gammaproteobacteria bacterium]
MPPRDVTSACIGVCEMAADACTGCGRQLDDIAAWPAAGTGQRLGILLQAARRLADHAPRPWPRRVRDALGRELLLKAPPQRIVSLVPSQTELLFDLGLGERVVGVTKFCVHPAQAREQRRRIGGTKTPDIDRIRALAPDFVLANREENRREDVAAIGAFAPVYVTDINTLPQALTMTRAVGFALGAEAAAARIAADIESAFAALPRRDAVRCAYLIWRQPWMAAGGDTFIGDLLRRLGLTNVFDDQPRYPEVAIEDLAAAAPALILLSSEPYPFKRAHAVELATQLPHTRIVPVDGEMFCWPGSRLLAAAGYFRNVLPTLGGEPGVFW